MDNQPPKKFIYRIKYNTCGVYIRLFTDIEELTEHFANNNIKMSYTVEILKTNGEWKPYNNIQDYSTEYDNNAYTRS